MEGLRGVVRTGEQIAIMGSIQGDLPWRDAERVGLTLLAHARQARRAQFAREGRCRDCGGPLDPAAAAMSMHAGEPDVCDENCPGWRVKLPEEVEAA